MLEEIEKLKKIELHVHLDGSISLDLASKLTNLPILKIKEQMVAKDKCLDLGEYLLMFDLPNSFMQTKENLKLIATDLVNRLEQENVIYAEIRFAPVLHTKKGLTQEEVVRAVLEGLKENKKVKTNLILSLMRGFSRQDNLKTIEVAYLYLGKGVVAIDLAGDEKKYKLKEYKELFLFAKKKKIPFTIHAGEVDYKDLKDAINLGVKRIGHGVKCVDKKGLKDLILRKNILLEICPTSNIQTNAFPSLKEHPVYLLYKENFNISINTDNRTVSNTTLNQEYLKLMKTFPFTKSDFLKMNLNSVNYTFLTPLEKIELLEKLK